MRDGACPGGALLGKLGGRLAGGGLGRFLRGGGLGGCLGGGGLSPSITAEASTNEAHSAIAAQASDSEDCPEQAASPIEEAIK